MTDEPEFVFELRTCEWAEREWPPHDEPQPVVISRQLGTRRRRWDTLVLEVDPEAFRQRAAFGEDHLNADLLHVVRHAPAEWSWYRDVLPDPGYPWRYVREAIHTAADRGALETQRNGNRIEIRRIKPYPDWVRRIIAIENKPDLDASAARALAGQLERDVALGLADEVWLATSTTGDYVEPALLEDLPPEAGILTLDHDAGAADVLWYPRSLAVDEPGTRILERPSGGRHDLSAARFEYVSPAEKRRKRLEIAERAYERGWRSHIETMRPDCRHYQLRRDGRAMLPWCGAKGRCQTGAECSGACEQFEPEPPAWRTKGWPLDGGPGRAIRRLLAARRERRRPE